MCIHTFRMFTISTTIEDDSIWFALAALCIVWVYEAFR